MIRSMTGFGRSEVRTERFEVRVEARSVNNRNLRVTFRLPETLLGLESELEKRVRRAVSRGTVVIVVLLDELTGDSGYVLDAGVIRQYRDAFVTLRGELDLTGEVPLDVLLTLPGAVRKAKSIEDVPAGLGKAAFDALDAALSALVTGREEEGAALWRDMASRCGAISALLGRVEGQVPAMVEAYSRRLSDRLGRLLSTVGSSLTEEEFRKEIALFADRSDISEEIARLRSHIQLMSGMDSSEEPCGRRLEFIAQEMFREANTMASKASDATMVQEILDIKAEIEKIREQAMNVE